MLDPDLDLEADLGIDSIKRAEVLGELAQRLGLAGAGGPGDVDDVGESVVEELARVKTIRGIVDWVVGRAAAPPADDLEDSAGYSSEMPVLSGTKPLDHIEGERALGRFVVEAAPLAPLPDWRELAAGGGGVGAGRRFAVVEGGLGIGLELASLLEAAGAGVRILAPGEAGLVGHVAAGAGADGLLWLASADAGSGSPATLPGAFPALRAAALGGTRRLLVVTGSGGAAGAGGDLEAAALGRDGDPRVAAAAVGVEPAPAGGLAGFVRAVAREVPELSVRLIDIDPKEAPTRLAGQLLAELFDVGGPPVVGIRGGVRSAPVLVAAGVEAATPPLPAGLGPSSVVLLTGGARGITAKVAVELARRTGCAVELVGRTPLPPGPEDPATAGAPDAPALRRALVAAGMRRPADVEARVPPCWPSGRYGRRWPLSPTARPPCFTTPSTSPTPSGCTASSRTSTPGMAASMASCTAPVCSRISSYQTRRLNRSPGVCHEGGWCSRAARGGAAGRGLPRLLRQRRGGVRQPGAGGLRRGQRRARRARPAGRTQVQRPGGVGGLGSVGHGRLGCGTRGGGMVSAELGRAYARRGVGLIDPDEGVAAFLRELALAGDAPAQVVYVCGSVEAFGG
jgi:hypothetical protein